MSVKAIADGELTDVAIHVTDSTSGKDVGGGRTYTSPDTNPRLIPLDDGTYDVLVKAAGMEGKIERRFEGIEIKDGSKVEKVVDFSTGELTIGVTRNGILSDATYRIYVAGTSEEVDAGRTYTGEKTNPSTVRITAGTYDIEIRSVEIAGKPTHRVSDVPIGPGGSARVSQDFVSGTLKVGAVKDGELVDVTVYVKSVETGKSVGQGRTYTHEKSNPKTFELVPGEYTVSLKAVRLEGKPQREIEVTIVVGGTAEHHMVDFGS